MKTDFSLASIGKNRRPRKPIEIAMTPMIDVIFLLLVFFLATSSFQLVEQNLPSGVSEIDAPTGNAVEPPPEPNQDQLEQVIVRLEQNAEQTQIRINGALLAARDEVSSRLQGISAVKPDVPIIIDPDPEVPASEVIFAYDQARKAGLLRVFLATRP